MEEDVEAQASALHLQVMLQKGQVAGGRYGEKFGEALDEPEEKRGYGMHEAEIYHCSVEGAT